MVRIFIFFIDVVLYQVVVKKTHMNTDHIGMYPNELYTGCILIRGSVTTTSLQVVLFVKRINILIESGTVKIIDCSMSNVNIFVKIQKRHSGEF